MSRPRRVRHGTDYFMPRGALAVGQAGADLVGMAASVMRLHVIVGAVSSAQVHQAMFLADGVSIAVGQEQQEIAAHAARGQRVILRGLDVDAAQDVSVSADATVEISPLHLRDSLALVNGQRSG